MAPPLGQVFYIGLYREIVKKIFLSETRRPRLLVIGIKLHLVALYQVCWSHSPGAKNDSAWGHMFYTGFYRQNVKNLFF